MKKLGIGMLICLLLTGCNKPYQPLAKGSEIDVMIATDLHYLANDYHDDGKQSQQLYELRDGKMVKYINEITQTFIDTALQEEPDVVLLTGDLSFNGEEASHKEMAAMLQKLVDAGIQVLVMPGNHDIRNPYALSYQGDDVYHENTVEADDFVKIYQQCGYQNASSRDKNSLSYLYKVSEDVWFLLIDTNGYEYNTGFGLNNVGKIKSGSMDWIRECFKEAEKEQARIYTVTHHSLLENEYLHTDDYRIQNGKELRELMADYGTKVHFSGHIHTQSIISQQVKESEIYEIATESLAVAENLYGKVKITSGSFDYQAVPLDVACWAKKNGVTNSDLLNFKSYARDFYQKVSYDHFLKNYETIAVDQKVKEQVAYVLAVLNPYYFSGNVDAVVDEIVNSKEYKTAKQFKDQFSSNYLDRILLKRALNQRKLSISFEKN